MRKKNLVRPHIFYTLWLKFRDSRNIFLFIVMNIFLRFKNAYFLVSSCILSFIFMTVLKRNELSSKQKPCFLFLFLVAWLVFKQSSFYRHIQKEISSCLFLFLFSFLEPHKLTCKLTSPHSILSGKFCKLLYVLDHHLLDLKKKYCCCKLEHFFL